MVLIHVSDYVSFRWLLLSMSKTMTHVEKYIEDAMCI